LAKFRGLAGRRRDARLASRRGRQRSDYEDGRQINLEGRTAETRFDFYDWQLFGADVYGLATAFDTTDADVDGFIDTVRTSASSARSR